jgi:hypothetical protein
VREEQGFIFRVPKHLMPRIEEIAGRSGIPRSTVTRLLLEQGVNEPPKWVRDLMDSKQPNGKSREKVAV